MARCAAAVQLRVVLQTAATVPSRRKSDSVLHSADTVHSLSPRRLAAHMENSYGVFSVKPINVCEIVKTALVDSSGRTSAALPK